MAALETSSAVNLGELSAGRLVGQLEYKIKSSKALEEGGPDGLVRTLGYVPEKMAIEEVGPFSAGVDLPQDLNAAESIANERPMANKGRGETGPYRLHVVVEQDDRYAGATGNMDLNGLARVALATTCIAAQKAGSSVNLVSVRDDAKPLLLSERRTDPTEVMRRFDKHATASREQALENLDPTKVRQSTALSQGLKLIEEAVHPTEDVVLVVSDFLAGTKEKDGHVTGFNWQKQFKSMRDRLAARDARGGRLFAVRLTSPSQLQLPLASEFIADGTAMELDFGEYLEAASDYQRQAEEKDLCLQGILKGSRLMNFSSETKTPFKDISRFVFDNPR